MGFPGDSDGKESAYNAGDLGLIPGLGRSPEERNGYPLQYSGLQNSMDRGSWQTTVFEVAKSQMDWVTFKKKKKSLFKYITLANIKGERDNRHWLPLMILGI